MIRKITVLLAGMLVTVAAYAAGAQLRANHPDSYTVRRGDTLWAISAKFLAKPWLWPEIWQANPQVRNPHLIYPGDVLNLSFINGSGGPSLRLDCVPRPSFRPLQPGVQYVRFPGVVLQAASARLRGIACVCHLQPLRS